MGQSSVSNKGRMQDKKEDLRREQPSKKGRKTFQIVNNQFTFTVKFSSQPYLDHIRYAIHGYTAPLLSPSSLLPHTHADTHTQAHLEIAQSGPFSVLTFIFVYLLIKITISYKRCSISLYNIAYISIKFFVFILCHLHELFTYYVCIYMYMYVYTHTHHTFQSVSTSTCMRLSVTVTQNH